MSYKNNWYKLQWWPIYIAAISVIILIIRYALGYGWTF